MNPETMLVVLLTIAAMRPFFEVPDAAKKSAALKRGGYQPDVKRGCLYVLLIPVMLGLWWWYATSTNQILLGVIPTVGATTTILAHLVEHWLRPTTQPRSDQGVT